MEGRNEQIYKFKMIELESDSKNSNLNLSTETSDFNFKDNYSINFQSKPACNLWLKSEM